MRCYLGQIELKKGAEHFLIQLFVFLTLCHPQELTIRQEMGDIKGECKAHGHLGAVHMSLANYTNAMKCYEEQLERAKELKVRSDFLYRGDASTTPPLSQPCITILLSSTSSLASSFTITPSLPPSVYLSLILYHHSLASHSSPVLTPSSCPHPLPSLLSATSPFIPHHHPFPPSLPHALA